MQEFHKRGGELPQKDQQVALSPHEHYSLLFEGISPGDPQALRKVAEVFLGPLHFSIAEAKKILEHPPVIICEDDTIEHLLEIYQILQQAGADITIVHANENGEQKEVCPDSHPTAAVILPVPDRSLIHGTGLELDLEERETISSQVKEVVSNLKKNKLLLEDLDKKFPRKPHKILSSVLVRNNQTTSKQEHSTAAVLLSDLFDTEAEVLVPYSPYQSQGDPFQSVRLLKKNKYLSELGENTRTSLYRFYRMIPHTGVSAHCLRYFARELAPDAGFARGCIFFLDRERESLVPKVAIGSSMLSEFSSINQSPMLAGNELVSEAYSADHPILERNVWSPALCYFIAAPFGIMQRTGVLLLETSGTLAEDPDANLVHYFQVLQKALMDSLHLT